MSTCIGDGRHRVSEREEFIAARSAFFPALEVFARANYASAYPVHLHDRWQLTWILSGSVALSHRCGSHLLRRGDAVLAAPFEPIGGRTHDGSYFGFVTLQIPGDLFPGRDDRCIVARHGGGALCENLMMRLLAASTAAEQCTALRQLAEEFPSSELDCMLLAGERPALHPGIRRVRRMLEGMVAENLRVTELAKAVRLNHRYLISLFRAAVGISPHQYLMARRLESARRLLNEGRELNVVAAETGFSDQSHLTNQFKRTFGATPGAYQARHCKMNFLQNFPLATA